MKSCVMGLNSINVENEKNNCLRHLSKIKSNKCKNYPNARWKHAAVVYQNNLYIMGGCSWTSILKDLWILNLNTFCKSIQEQIGIRGFWNVFNEHDNYKELWHDLSDFVGHIPPLQSHSMVAYDNKLYIFGGTFVYDAKDCPLWIFDIELNFMKKWKANDNSDVPAPRRNHSCSIYRDTMLIFGGFGDIRGSFGDLWGFDLKNLKWHLVWSSQRSTKEKIYTINSQGPCPRHDHSSVIHQNCLWVYGGMNGLEECYDLWRWNFDYSQWTKINYKIGPSNMQFTNNVMIGHNWVFYGANESKNRPEKWKYSFKLNRWILDNAHIPELLPHSTISLTNYYNSKFRSITNSHNACIKRNKVSPMTEPDFYSEYSKRSSDVLFCLKSCSTINSLRVGQRLPTSESFERLTPLDILSEDYYGFDNCFDNQIETTFIDDVDDSIASGARRQMDFAIHLGNNIDKCTFEDSIGFAFQLL